MSALNSGDKTFPSIDDFDGLKLNPWIKYFHPKMEFLFIVFSFLDTHLGRIKVPTLTILLLVFWVRFYECLAIHVKEKNELLCS